MFHLNTEFFKELRQREQPINRAKTYEENIARRHVTFRLSPNGTVEVYVTTTDTPFRIDRDEDVSALFAFLGQVRDRFLYHVSDIKEQHVPNLLNWILKQCDLNKDVEIDDVAQLTFPDIQLKSADRVFRLYVKVIKDKSYCRESPLHLRYQDCISCHRRTEFMCIKCSYCYSCHWNRAS